MNISRTRSRLLSPHAITACFLFFIAVSTIAQKKPEPPRPLAFSKGKLVYTPDSLGNRIPDFSYCGYMAGEEAIPVMNEFLIVPLTNGDATARIQAAIDKLSKQPLKNGIRGAVLLEKGTYIIEGSLRLHTSGVVIAGIGFGENGTILLGAGKDRATLITIEGKTNNQSIGVPVSITDQYIPVNATTVSLQQSNNLKVGDTIIITRYDKKEWIDALGTAHFGGGITALGWKPRQRTINWRRIVTSVKGNTISFDAPVTTALDNKYDESYVSKYSGAGLVSHCGVQNLQLVSAYDNNNPKDEDHRWMAITINNAMDCWVKQVRFTHFAGSAVAVYENASRVTVEDCISVKPISEIGGERRNTFFTSGQQVLFQRCYAEYGIHDFATGFCAAGPNAFVQCESRLPYSFSGGLDSWSSGVLFDIVNIDGHNISFMNRGQDGQGAGWTIANSVLWNCSAARIDCYKPPTAQNWAFGAWSQFAGDGYWIESNNNIEPRSLYYAQLSERIGADKIKGSRTILPMETDATSSPTVEQAMALTKVAIKPAKTLLEFIEEARSMEVYQSYRLTSTLKDADVPVKNILAKAPPLQLKNGCLLRGDALLVGDRNSVPWWNGNAKPYGTLNAGMAITRFVPGRTGRGMTDDLTAVTDTMLAKNIIGIEQNYGLWYDRRRDDHERIRRADGEVWAPFYELPFARSGKELAWDGLSKYDLTKYNYWYWNRLKQFADLADQKGLLLVYQNYFQHNIIEAGAHYADFPWRTANNINNTGFPEPVPYAGDKRIFMTEQFYDITDPVRRSLHRSYIRQCLDNFSNNTGVIHTVGEEYTGPLHFVQFWIDIIKEWETETGKHPLIALSVTKDVQDAILADPTRAEVIDIIDIRYWHYQADGSEYAPKGGQNLAPRQHARLLKPKSTSADQVYRAVREYKEKFPAKAVIYSGDSNDRFGWAVLMAGGSLPNVRIKDQAFAKTISTMKPDAMEGYGAKQWVLSNDQGYIIYGNGDKFTLDINAGNYEVIWINGQSGDMQKEKAIKGDKNISMFKPSGQQMTLWLKKK